VLESLNQEKNTSRIIHIIRPSETKDCFKLGRGHESDLRINDISVSRCHAKIKFSNGKFQLEDNTSKFGTLVLVKQRTPLLPNYNKAVQIGRTVLNFSVKANNHRNLTSTSVENSKKVPADNFKNAPTQAEDDNAMNQPNMLNSDQKNLPHMQTSVNFFPQEQNQAQPLMEGFAGQIMQVPEAQ
jgi:pSer/pThr/pTyr-binding forkhead associated (FHA) protein